MNAGLAQLSGTPAAARVLPTESSDFSLADVGLPTPASERCSEVLRLIGRGVLVSVGLVGLSFMVSAARSAHATDGSADTSPEASDTAASTEISAQTATPVADSSDTNRAVPQAEPIIDQPLLSTDTKTSATDTDDSVETRLETQSVESSDVMQVTAQAAPQAESPDIDRAVQVASNSSVVESLKPSDVMQKTAQAAPQAESPDIDRAVQVASNSSAVESSQSSNVMAQAAPQAETPDMNRPVQVAGNSSVVESSQSSNVMAQAAPQAETPEINRAVPDASEPMDEAVTVKDLASLSAREATPSVSNPTPLSLDKALTPLSTLVDDVTAPVADLADSVVSHPSPEATSTRGSDEGRRSSRHAPMPRPLDDVDDAVTTVLGEATETVRPDTVPMPMPIDDVDDAVTTVLGDATEMVRPDTAPMPMPIGDIDDAVTKLVGDVTAPVDELLGIVLPTPMRPQPVDNRPPAEALSSPTAETSAQPEVAARSTLTTTAAPAPTPVEAGPLDSIVQPLLGTVQSTLATVLGSLHLGGAPEEDSLAEATSEVLSLGGDDDEGLLQPVVEPVLDTVEPVLRTVNSLLAPVERIVEPVTKTADDATEVLSSEEAEDDSLLTPVLGLTRSLLAPASERVVPVAEDALGAENFEPIATLLSVSRADGGAPAAESEETELTTQVLSAQVLSAPSRVAAVMPPQELLSGVAPISRFAPLAESFDVEALPFALATLADTAHEIGDEANAASAIALAFRALQLPNIDLPLTSDRTTHVPYGGGGVAHSASRSDVDPVGFGPHQTQSAAPAPAPAPAPSSSSGSAGSGGSGAPTGLAVLPTASSGGGSDSVTVQPEETLGHAGPVDRPTFSPD